MMEIRFALRDDLSVLKDIFWAHINVQNEYISHGELQMGVAEADVSGGTLKTRPAGNGEEMWMKYINAKFDSPDAVIMVAEEDGFITGFCVAEITDDGADPFGVLCDLLVNGQYRGRGIGGELLQKTLGWLKGRGISDVYLESGKNNGGAHEFFRRRGFVHISDVFRLV